MQNQKLKERIKAISQDARRVRNRLIRLIEPHSLGPTAKTREALFNALTREHRLLLENRKLLLENEFLKKRKPYQQTKKVY